LLQAGEASFLRLAAGIAVIVIAVPHSDSNRRNAAASLVLALFAASKPLIETGGGRGLAVAEPAVANLPPRNRRAPSGRGWPSGPDGRGRWIRHAEWADRCCQVLIPMMAIAAKLAAKPTAVAIPARPARSDGRTLRPPLAGPARRRLARFPGVSAEERSIAAHVDDPRYGRTTAGTARAARRA